MTSLKPPIPISFEAINSLSQLFFSEKCEYNRNRSAANKAASSPPVPALISKIMFLLSSGSFGNNFILRSFSRSNFYFYSLLILLLLALSTHRHQNLS